MSNAEPIDQAAVDRNLCQRVNVGDLLTRAAARAPHHLAVVDRDRRVTYRDLNNSTNRFACGLQAQGYDRGDKLGLMSPNRAEFLVAYFACAKLGIVCVPVNLFWKGGELGYVIKHAALKGIVVDAALLDQLRPGLQDTPVIDLIIMDLLQDPNLPGYPVHDFHAMQKGMPSDEPVAYVHDRDPITYLYTSGTTSAPKAVVSSHVAVYIASMGAAIETRMTAADRVTALLPLFHTAQLNAIATPVVVVGGTLLIQRGFDAARMQALIRDERVSVLFALPMMYRALLEQHERQPGEIGSLRLAIYAMAPMPKHELQRLIAAFRCEFSLMFGQTEMNPTSAYFRPEHQLSHAGSVGTPSTNVQVGIVDATGQALPQGQSGEIVYRSPQLLTEYLQNPPATDAAFAGGWFHSGDSGYFDEDGLLWFEDRFKDVIKSGGENIASIEVEKAVYAADPGVQEVAVIGLPHDRWTEAVTAVVTLKPGCPADEAALMIKVRDHLSPFKCPKMIIFADAMPKTATGKVQKAKLRDIYREAYSVLVSSL